MEGISERVLRTYIDETTDRLIDLEKWLKTVPLDGSWPDTDELNRIFRDAHSIKAGANLLGFTTIERLSHSMENLLDLYRKHERLPSSDELEALLRSIDRMHDLVENIEVSNEMDIEEQVSQLARLA